MKSKDPSSSNSADAVTTVKYKPLGLCLEFCLLWIIVMPWERKVKVCFFGTMLLCPCVYFDAVYNWEKNNHFVQWQHPASITCALTLKDADFYLGQCTDICAVLFTPCQAKTAHKESLSKIWYLLHDFEFKHCRCVILFLIKYLLMLWETMMVTYGVKP